MSIKIMSEVWEHSTSTGTARLVLLAIADHAGDDRREAFPSVSTLARKVRCSERTVQYAITELVDAGELTVLKGQGRHGCNVYRITQLYRGAKSAGVQNTTEGVHHVAPGGCTTLHPNRHITIKEPSGISESKPAGGILISSPSATEALPERQVKQPRVKSKLAGNSFTDEELLSLAVAPSSPIAAQLRWHQLHGTSLD
jgi:hypothetical protein